MKPKKLIDFIKEHNGEQMDIYVNGKLFKYVSIYEISSRIIVVRAEKSITGSLYVECEC